MPARADTLSADDARAIVGRYLADAAFRVASGPQLEQLAASHPVLDLGPLWLVSGYDELTSLTGRDCLQTLPEVGGARLQLAASERLADRFALALPMRDGPDHRRLRSLVHSTFSSRGVESIEPVVAGCVHRRLDAAIGNGAFDLVADLAAPLPLDLSLAILGVEDRRDDVEAWTKGFKAHFLGADESTVEEVEGELDRFDDYVEALLGEPGPSSGVVAALVNAEAQGRLDHAELLAYVMLLLVNGLDTLTSAITDAAYELLAPQGHLHHDQMDRALAASCFEEVLRFHSPVRLSARVLTAQVEVAGELLPSGAVVGLFFAAANRDPRRFERPGEFDPARPPGRHLAFGHGPHKCLGRHLADLAGSIVLERLSALRTRLTLGCAADELEWSSSLLYHTLQSLPVVVSG